MSRYSVVENKIWDDPHYRESPMNIKMIFHFLINNRYMTRSGVYQISIVTISDYTGVSIEEVETALRERQLIMRNIFFDFDNSIVYVKNHLRYNNAGSRQVLLQSIVRDIQTIRTPLWDKFFAHYKDIIKEIKNKYQIDVINTYGAGERKKISIDKKLRDATGPTAEEIVTALRHLPPHLHEKYREQLDKAYPEGHEFDKAMEMLKKE